MLATLSTHEAEPLIDTLAPETSIGSMTQVERSRWPRSIWLWVFAGAGILFVAVSFRPIIEGDGVGYYSYLHAVLVSHSLDFANEYSSAFASGISVHRALLTAHTTSGQLANYFPIGSAVLSAPAYLVALALNPSGAPQYGSPFVEAFSAASLLYGLVALGICYRLVVSAVGSNRAALAGVAGGLLATPLYYYAFAEPSYSHTFSLFCVSAFLYAWWKGPPTSGWGWLGLGVLGGLMGMTRYQDGLLLAIVLLDFRRLKAQALLLVPGAIIGFAPQLFVDHVEFGGLLPARPVGQDLNPLQGHYLEVLFGSRNGLFIWVPAAALAAVGVGLLRDRRLQAACVVAFILELAVVGAAPDSAGASFGPRRFIELTPFVIVGLAAVVDRIHDRLALIVVGALCLWNLTLVANFEYPLASIGDPGYWQLTAGQLQAVPYLPRLFGKGIVLRELLLSSQAHVRFDIAGAIAMLGVEAACVAAALWVAVGSSRWRRETSLAGPSR